MSKKLWVCGQIRQKVKGTNRHIWDFQGIFSSEKKAVLACINERYFIYSVELDHEYPEERVRAKGGYYPCVKPTILSREEPDDEEGNTNPERGA